MQIYLLLHNTTEFTFNLQNCQNDKQNVVSVASRVK
jgi:hypothetical protein